MKVIVQSPEQIAKLAAEQYRALLGEKPNAVLGLATGSTPLGLYRELARLNKAGALSFARATSFNLDEYDGLPAGHAQSYRTFMDENLFSHIDIPIERTYIPGRADVSDADGQGYDAAIARAGGIDLQLLGIGNNGHIGFNEPCTPFGSRTHLAELTPSTREANTRFFSSIGEVPTQAITMGIRTVMNARAILLIALGAAKAEALRATVSGPVTELVPASVLQLHPNVTIYADSDAAKLL
ncbi:MAG: glucosamine-6-phosphate deaminase [Clostridiales bacterium]|nr:glucosamine-6-phosphate deaminase [Clostridiales bacterium]